MGALDRKERVNCVWTKVVPFLFQASPLISNDLFMFLRDLFISCVADSMQRKKSSVIRSVLRTRCFSRPGSYWCTVNKLYVGGATFAQEALSSHWCSQNAQPYFFLYCSLWCARGSHDVHLFCFVFCFFSRPIFGTAAGAVKYKNSFSPEFYFTHNGTVQIKNTLSRIWYLPHEL